MQIAGSDLFRLQTAEQSLLKANLIVSGQSKQLDDLRFENDQLVQKLAELKACPEPPRHHSEVPTDEIRHSDSGENGVVTSGDTDAALAHSQNASAIDTMRCQLIESERNKQEISEKLDETRQALAMSKSQCSAAEIEIRILRSQLEALSDGSSAFIANEKKMQSRINEFKKNSLRGKLLPKFKEKMLNTSETNCS